MRRTREWTTAQRLIVTLTATVTVVLIVTALVSVVVIRGLIDDRINSRMLDTSQRVRASLVGLPGLVIDRPTVENMAKSGSAVVVMLQDGRPVMWINGEADTAAAGDGVRADRRAAAYGAGPGRPHGDLARHRRHRPHGGRR